MGEKTKIAWCHHTFNAWWGCTKVSPACTNCYADDWAKRCGQKVWGPKAPRRFFGTKHWRDPLKWDREAQTAGERRRVFCGSMMDVLERHDDPDIRREQDTVRRQLVALIYATPGLDWLLLTKRPENFAECFPEWKDGCPPNVWFGATVENQEYADLRIPHLLKIPAVVRFLSCEPLLGPVDLSRWIRRVDHCKDCGEENEPVKEARCRRCQSERGLTSTWGEEQARRFHSGERYENGGPCDDEDGPALHWVIAGGESGPKHRAHQLEHSRLLRDQCVAAGVPFFFKQTVEFAIEKLYERLPNGGEVRGSRTLPLAPRSKGESLDEIPPDLRIREFPTTRAA